MLIFTLLLFSASLFSTFQKCVSFSPKRNGKFGVDFSGCPSIENQCSHTQDDIPTLLCAVGVIHSNKTQISIACHNKVWSMIALLIDNEFLSSKLSDQCVTEPIVIECLTKPLINALDCILIKKSAVQDRICMRAITKIELLVFSDWQLVQNFIKYCREDIETHSCGRITVDPKSLSQVDTMKCLDKYEPKLQQECQVEYTVLKDMMYTTLQPDKVVFAVCSADRLEFCAHEIPSSWYKCLLQHKYDSKMTKKCKDRLFTEQKSIVQNYKMSKGLTRACKEDIRTYRCRKGVVDDKDVRLAQILLCLENVARNDSTKISSECNVEMVDHRKMLLEDYRLSPEIMHDCANDITLFCKGIEAGGKTIHCLMEHARPRRKKERRISLNCQKSLDKLIQEADPGENWRVDPILREACRTVVDSACIDVVGGNGRVMSCLMEKINTRFMTEECEAALLQIQYFISRDFRLDPTLYKACKFDAVTQCKAKLSWADEAQYQPEKNLLILPCLYNYAYDKDNKNYQLKPACEQQIRRVMRQRAMSVDLLPEIEDVCIDDLANYCYENTGKGEEISCLQTKISQLTIKCKEAVTNFTQLQIGHTELNSVISVHCRIPIEKLCASTLQSKKGEDDDIMDCLISHKNEPLIKSLMKCRAAIEHQQLISLTNYRFTKKFMNACRSYVVKYCPIAQTKGQVVACLSEIVRNDTIMGKKYTIIKECRQQIRSQLFQQKESIDLDPELREACRKDLAHYCPNVSHGEAAALECLQTSKERLSEKCRKAVFVVKKQEFADNAVDYHLITSCKDMIDMYCPNTEPGKILDCLKSHRQKPNFEENCKVVVVNRMIEQNSDYRFNINLQNSCKMDIKKFCADIIANQPQDVELEGKVIHCLKGKFRESKLTSSCENELADVLKEQALDHRLDPLLGRLCKAEIQTICKDTAVSNTDGQVVECLKNALLNHEIVSGECAQEVAQIIEETEVDIDADPLLERACALDLLKYCRDLVHGASRRLKCLQIILNRDPSNLEPECCKQLANRLEMYRQVAAIRAPEDIGEFYSQVSSSPSKKYFVIVFMSMVGLVFIFGLFCGRMTRRSMYIKRK